MSKKVECRIIVNLIENGMENLRSRVEEVLTDLEAKITGENRGEVRLEDGELVTVVVDDSREYRNGAESAATVVVRSVEDNYTYRK